MSDEADPLYRPLGGLEPWAAVPVDGAAWTRALGGLRGVDPDVAAMVLRGTLLAAAYQSAALDCVYAGDRDVALALVRGAATLASLDEAARPHVRANYEALLVAARVDVSEAAIRRIHEVACRPQATHRVLVETRVQDHVMAAGDYKHHPNHGLDPDGAWRPTAPVAQVRPEMARLVATAASAAFDDLHPLARAAYLHDALLHVQPFADGNGRAARALAGGCLIRAASLPLLCFAEGTGVAFVQETFLSTVDLYGQACSDPDQGALDRWRAEYEAADTLGVAVAAGAGRALDRYDGHRADLSAAVVIAEDPLVLRVPLPGKPDVDEVLRVDAHPLDGGPLTVVAEEARLRLELGAPLDPWLDRVVSCLALRVAAQLDDMP